MLIAISCGNYNQIKTLIQGGESHRPCHIHQLHAEKPILSAVVQDCHAKAMHYRDEMIYCKQISNECNVRVKIIQRKLRENSENQQMIVEEEAICKFDVQNNSIATIVIAVIECLLVVC